MNSSTILTPPCYQEVRLHSAGAPIVLSVWMRDPAAATVVFYPGTMSSALCYETFLTQLAAQGFNVIGLHPLSHGKSPRLRNCFTFADILQNGKDAVAWTRSQCTGPIVLAGHSQGGILALAHAADAPDLAAAFLLCTLLPQHPRAIEVTLFKPFARWHKGLLRALCRLARLTPRLPVIVPMYLSLSKIFHGSTGMQRPKDCMRAAYPLAFLASLFSAPLEQATQPSMRQNTQGGGINCPIELITAHNDALFPPELMQCMLAAIAAPDKKHILLPGGGHMAPLIPQYAAYIAQHMAQRCASLGLPLHSSSSTA